MNQNTYNKVVEYIIENQEKFYRLAFSYAKNKEDALDIVQNSICRALESYETIRNINALKTWFYRVLVNESISYIKKNHKEALLYESNTENIVCYENSYKVNEDLYERINLLALDVQNIIKLRFYEEMSLKEISEIMELNINTVKAKLYRGLKILRQEIQEVTIWSK